ncbi:hypothetical protein [Luteimonas abyssi]|uniref:hypothetical protein n=1 Tax=Luteimonas abyssi TaxID=1247514 RepID=UPI000737B606|nr:hypothetical protein [Luteimonas abyssi]
MSLLPPRPVASLFALAMLVIWPALAWGLIHALSDPMHCGRWGLECFGRAVMSALGGWVVGAICAAAGLIRGESRGFAATVLALNVLPLLLVLAATLAIMAR